MQVRRGLRIIAPAQQCTYTFHAALAQALPARESQDLIRTVMEEL